MTGERFRPDVRVVVRALLALLIGMLAGGGLNAALGEQGADTPALALLGGGLGLGVAIVAQARRRAHQGREPLDPARQRREAPGNASAGIE